MGLIRPAARPMTTVRGSSHFFIHSLWGTTPAKIRQTPPTRNSQGAPVVEKG